MSARLREIPIEIILPKNARITDRIKARYRTGKYTGMVWAAEIEQEFELT